MVWSREYKVYMSIEYRVYSIEYIVPHELPMVEQSCDGLFRKG